MRQSEKCSSINVSHGIVVPSKSKLRAWNMVNRGALMLRYEQPAVDWINKVDPTKSGSFTLESVNTDRTVYLVSNEVADSPESIKEWVKLNCELLFENELFNWYVDES
ncbi:hypothetical protein L1D18_23010 [Vibrio parahaemolyticus]|nr:hypothetical protein [Vibrio parahaemolyticus]MCG9646935.1 hypothetical protein [Vibrio parahaemolyticus]